MPGVRSKRTVHVETGGTGVTREETTTTPKPTSTTTQEATGTASTQVKEDTEICLLCIEPPVDPKTLLCGHAFCTQCLLDYMDDYPTLDHRDEGEPWTSETEQAQHMRCPTCLQTTRTDSDLPPGGVVENRDKRHGGESSKVVNPSPAPQQCDVCSYSSKSANTEVHCGKCALSLCSECKEVHGSHVLFNSHPVVNIATTVSLSIYCDKHHNLQSLYFCDRCQHACCAVCILQEHSGHSACTLIDALNYRRNKLKSLLKSMSPQLDKIESRLKTLNQIASKKTQTNTQSIFRSVSEPTYDLNQSMDSQSDAYSKNEFDIFEETSQLLPQSQFTLQNEKISVRTPPRKSKSLDQGKKVHRVFSFSLMGRKKTSFPDNFHTNKMSKEQISVGLHLNMGLQVGNQDANPPSKSPSPRSKRKASRRSSSSSKSSVNSRKSPTVTPPWHQFTRMGNISPVLQKRKLTLTKSNPYPMSPLQDLPQVGKLALLDVQPCAPVDISLVGKYQYRLQLICKLSNYAAKTVSTKRFLGMFDELDERLISATDIEMMQLKKRVHNLMDKHEAALQTIAISPSSSISSMDMIGGIPLRKSPPSDSNGIKGQTGADATLHRQLSVLIKPKLLWKTEKHKNDPGDLWNRCGIAFLSNGNTVVAEYDMNNVKNNRLHIYNNQGETVSMICEEQVWPLGVAVTPEGNIAITDCRSKRVKVVTDTGQPVCEWGKGHFGWPHGIAINSKGQFIVSDAFNDFISIHHPDGKIIQQIGCSGSSNECFRNPFHIAVDHKDNIIVSDCGNNCIKVFDTNGKFLFSNRGVSATSLEGFDANNKSRILKSPRGVAVDPKGNILVADDSSRVVMFDSRGKYIRNVLTEEEHVNLSGEEHVKFVEGMAMNMDGVLALTECNPSQMFAVKVFSLYESSEDEAVHLPISNGRCFKIGSSD